MDAKIGGVLKRGPRLRGTHLDIVHTHEVSTVVQVLLQVTVLEESLAQPCPVLPCPLAGRPSLGRVQAQVWDMSLVQSCS